MGFQQERKWVREFRRTWESACKAAGVPGRIPHDFRRTSVRNLVRAGVPEVVAMKMMGHKTRSVFERYYIGSEGDLFEAARRLERFTGIVSGIGEAEEAKAESGASVQIIEKPSVV